MSNTVDEWDTEQRLTARFPVVGELSDEAWERVGEGQPMLLVHHGRPVAVVVDYESWQEVEALAVGE